MKSFFEWMLLIMLTTTFSLFLLLYIYFRHIFSYFQKRGIVYDTPTFLFGSLFPVVCLRQSYSETIRKLYFKHKRKRYIGFFQFFKKSLLVIDRELIKSVIISNYDHFDEKYIHYDQEIEPLTVNLFSLGGDEWKSLRQTLNPVFSIGKVKMMFETIADIGKQLKEHVIKLSADSEIIECKDIFTRYGVAIIYSTAFGIDSSALQDSSSPFFRVCTAIMSPNLNGMFRNALMFFGKDIAKVLRFRIIPKNTHDFVTKLVKDVVQYREEHNVKRNDFLQIMMELKKVCPKGETEKLLTTEELAAQSYIFILAAFEPVSIIMSFFLYEMAINPQIQQNVLEEVDKFDVINYDTLGDMEYLDMAIKETIRKHVPLGFLSRVCSKDYLIPGTNDVIEKGTNVIISSLGLHSDPDLFPDPELFLPERFNKENKANIKSCSYFPFGEGPRICIGKKFGQLSIKTGLVMLLKNFRVERTSKTPDPLQYEPCTVSTTAKGGLWLRFVPRTIVS